MSMVDDVLSIARLHKSQAEADVLRDMYFTENPGVIVEFCDAVIDLLEKQPKWIPVEERLPENAQHKGAHCPRYKVYTKWGETEGWYNPDKGCWYFLLWYFGEEGVDFERGDYPKLAHEINGAKVVTHWMPLSEPPKDGEA